MAKVLIYLSLLCFASFATAALPDPYYPSYFYPLEHRSNIIRPLQERSDVPPEYEFQIVPSDQYPEYDVALLDTTSTSLSLWNLIPDPIGAVVKAIVFKGLAIIHLVLSNGLWIALGASLVIGFCAFTPYCTLTIEKPLSRELRSLRQNVPYLDEVEDFFYRAYDRLHEING